MDTGFPGAGLGRASPQSSAQTTALKYDIQP